MNPMQRRAAERAAEQSVPAGADPGSGHWVVIGSALSFEGQTWPRGSVIPDAVIKKALHPQRLAVFTQNRLLAWRLGAAPEGTPQPKAIAPSSSVNAPEVERAMQRANMLRAGYHPSEVYERGNPNYVAPTPGAYARAIHPSEMTKASQFAVSQAGGLVEVSEPAPASPARPANSMSSWTQKVGPSKTGVSKNVRR